MATNGHATELTPRQREVLALVGKGRSNREIATALDITQDGVKAHLSRLFLRFGVGNRVELLAAANATPASDRQLSATASLGRLRAIVGRANSSALRLADGPQTEVVLTRLAAVREALAAVDVALDLVHELPAGTTGPVIDALRKRISSAFDALDEAAVAVPVAQQA